VDTSFDMYVGDFDTSISGNNLFYTENQFLNSTGTTISEEEDIDTTRYINNEGV